MSSDKETDKLIEELSAELTPVKRMLHPFLWIAPWFVIALAYLAGVINFLGLRMDLSQKLEEAPFLFELGLAGLIAITAGYTSGWLSIPDMRGRRWMLAVPVTLFAAFILFMLSKVIVAGISITALSWEHCFSDALLMGFVPIALLSLLVRRGATTMPGWMAFMSVLSVGALGWGALRLTCASENPGHTLLFHFMPFILLAAVLGMLARRIYRW